MVVNEFAETFFMNSLSIVTSMFIFPLTDAKKWKDMFEEAKTIVVTECELYKTVTDGKYYITCLIFNCKGLTYWLYPFLHLNNVSLNLFMRRSITSIVTPE